MRMTLLGLCLLIACGGDDGVPNSGPDAAIPVDASGSIDGAMTRSCGGFANLKCKADELCDYADNTCGVADGAGTCKPRPVACPLLVEHKVCGCDAKVHASECAAYIDGSDLSANGACDKVAGTFACGYLLCNLGQEYCRREPHPDAAETFTCVALLCADTPSCGCLANERCGDACTGDNTAGLTLTCPATPR